METVSREHHQQVINTMSDYINELKAELVSLRTERDAELNGKIEMGKIVERLKSQLERKYIEQGLNNLSESEVKDEQHRI